jgi:Tfp pilus assembly protein PilO
MDFSNLKKKAQSLPLSTIVIVILVVIVMIVILMFFFSTSGEQTDTVNKVSPSSCTPDNFLLSDYSASDLKELEEDVDSCAAMGDWEPIVGVPGCCKRKTN